MTTLQGLPELYEFFHVRQSPRSSSTGLKHGDYVVMDIAQSFISRNSTYQVFNLNTRRGHTVAATALKTGLAGEIVPLRTTLTNLLRFQAFFEQPMLRLSLTTLGRTDLLARMYLGDIRAGGNPDDMYITVGVSYEPGGPRILTVKRLGATLPLQKVKHDIREDELDRWRRLESSELSPQQRFVRYAAKYAYEDLTYPRQETQDLYDMICAIQQPREVSPPAPTIQPPLPPEAGHAIGEATLMRDDAAATQAIVHGLQQRITELEHQNRGLERELRKERAHTKDLAETREELARAAQQRADARVAELMSTHKAACEDLKRQMLARSPIPQSTWDLDDSAFPRRRRFAAMLRDFQDGDLTSRMDFSEDAGMLAYGSQLLWDVCDSYVTSRINKVTTGILQALQLQAFPEYMAAHMQDADLELMRANWQQLILPSAEVLRGLFDSFTQKVQAAGHVALLQCVESDAALTKRCIASYIQLIAVTKLSKPPIPVDDKRVIRTVEAFNKKLHTTIDGVASPMVTLLFPAFLNIDNIPVLCASTSPPMLISR